MTSPPLTTMHHNPTLTLALVLALTLALVLFRALALYLALVPVPDHARLVTPSAATSLPLHAQQGDAKT